MTRENHHSDLNIYYSLPLTIFPEEKCMFSRDGIYGFIIRDCLTAVFRILVIKQQENVQMQPLTLGFLLFAVQLSATS